MCTDIDFDDGEHINMIMTLCKRNNFYHMEVLNWLGLLEGFGGVLGDTTGAFTEQSKTIRQTLFLRGLFARYETMVVGFMLYSIDRKTKKTLTIDFLLVDHKYRNQNYGARLLRACEQRHFVTARQDEFESMLHHIGKEHMGVVWTKAIHEESRKLVRTTQEFVLQKQADILRNALSDYQQVRYITVHILRGQDLDRVVAFYMQNRFSDINDIPKMKHVVSHHPELFQMARENLAQNLLTSVQEY
jgi:GNAT superfamily N-acetyltransferase